MRRAAKPRVNAFSEEAYPKRYNPQAEGYGSPSKWRSAFHERMGFEEASRVKAEAQAAGRWRSEYSIVGDMAGVEISEDSMWGEIKSAFRKASMNCHPDRTAVHGKPKEVAEEEFKQVQAAFAILERRHQ